jgi:hypothetical protein
VDSTEMASGGYWSTYWYNGHIYGSEISRGLDVFELQPSGFISQNEIDAAKSVKLEYFNTQGQVKLSWPATYSLSRAYLDQLERSQGMAAGEIAEARTGLARAEKAGQSEQQQTLAQLVSRLESAVNGAGDAAKVQLLASAVRQLATSPSLAQAR